MGVVSFFLVFLAVVVVGAAAFLATGTLRGGGRTAVGLDETVPNLPPVLLPPNARPSDVDAVRFGLGLRGYRMDQVDEVLDELRDQLAAKDAEITGIRQALDAAADRGRDTEA
ncbi:DivIVA domain-containing protein [Arthrobacter cupressi]